MTAATRATPAGGHGRRPRRGRLVLHPPGPRLAQERARGGQDRPGGRLALGVDDFAPTFLIPLAEDDHLWARGGPGQRAEAQAGPEPRRPMAHQAVASGTFRGDGAASRPGVRRRAHRRGIGRRSPADRGTAAAPRPDSPARPERANHACFSSRPWQGSPTCSFPTIRAAPPGGGGGSCGRRDLHLHRSPPDRPLRPACCTVQSCVWCAPSFLKSCNRLECLAELSPDRVWPVVRKCLAGPLESAA